jgi:hypothetical protein
MRARPISNLEVERPAAHPAARAADERPVASNVNVLSAHYPSQSAPT